MMLIANKLLSPQSDKIWGVFEKFEFEKPFSIFIYLPLEMNFVYPAFLFALFAIAIPIIIHLFNFRKFKKVYFTNVRFLREIKQQTQSKAKLRHLLVLATRILAVTFLVLAFAQPYIPASSTVSNTGRQTVSIYLDNSFSMDAVNENGRVFDQARQLTLDIVTAYQPTDKFQLLTNDFEGRHQRLVNREEFTELIDEVEISPAVKTLSEVVSRQLDAIKDDPATSKTLFILSDFQRSITDLANVTVDSSVNIRLIPLQAEKANNLYIDSCWFVTPIRQMNQPEELIVRIRNKSEELFENVPVKLIINGNQKALASFSIEPESFVDTTLYFTSTETGIHHAEVIITDYPITFDDRFFFSYEVASHISVLNINAEDSNNYVNSLFGNDDFFQLTNSFENSLDYSAFATNSLVIVNGLQQLSSGLAQELKKMVEQGGSLLIFPGDDIDLNSYQNFLSSTRCNHFTKRDTNRTAITTINMEHQVYKNVFDNIPENIDLPKVNAHYRLTRNTNATEDYLLRLQDGSLFLGDYNYGKGSIYLCSSPLDGEWNNFAKHAVFVPTLYKIALLSQPSTKMFYTIGRDQVVELQNTAVSGDNVFHITSPNSQFDIIPEHKVINNVTNIFLHDQVREAGNYNVNSPADSRGISFNYERKESDLQLYDKDELQQLVETAGLFNFSLFQAQSKNVIRKLNEISEGKKFWRLCIILTLVFLAIEVLLLTLWKP